MSWANHAHLPEEHAFSHRLCPSVRINPLQPTPGGPTHPGLHPSLGYDPLVSKGQICRLSLGRIPTGIYLRAYCNSQYGDHTGPTRDCRNTFPQT